MQTISEFTFEVRTSVYVCKVPMEKQPFAFCFLQTGTLIDTSPAKVSGQNHEGVQLSIGFCVF